MSYYCAVRVGLLAFQCDFELSYRSGIASSDSTLACASVRLLAVVGLRQQLLVRSMGDGYTGFG